MSATCPLCGCDQAEGLLCHAETSRLERDLGDVAAIVRELETTISRQARVPAGFGHTAERPETADDEQGVSRLAHERLPIHLGAVQAADDLANTLTSWARDVAGIVPWAGQRNPTVLAASILLRCIPEIRRHPAVQELVEGIDEAISDARRVVDRPADRIFVGPCLAELEGVTCYEDLYARPTAGFVTCKVCGLEHEVAERRAWLLEQARDRLFTVREAAQMMGDVGGIKVTEASIRGYIHRGRIGYHTGTVIRLGDLLTVVLDESERKSA